jgi:hypothetical protein
MNKGLETSQKSKFFSDKEKRSFKKDTFYTHMFLEDFANLIIFSLTADYDNFITIEGESCEILKKLLKHTEARYLPYKFNHLLELIVADLLKYKRVYIEVIYFYNEEGKIVGLDFNLINNCRRIHGIRKIKFIAPYSREKRNSIAAKSFDIPIKDLIIIDYPKQLEKTMSRRKIIKKITSIPGISELPVSLIEKTSFDLNQYKIFEQIEVAKSTGYISWDGRNTFTDKMTDPYLLIRKANFKKAQRIMIDTIIDAFNKKLVDIGKVLGFNCLFKINGITIEQLNLMKEDIISGKIQFNEALDILFHRKR